MQERAKEVQILLDKFNNLSRLNELCKDSKQWLRLLDEEPVLFSSNVCLDTPSKENLICFQIPYLGAYQPSNQRVEKIYHALVWNIWKSVYYLSEITGKDDDRSGFYKTRISCVYFLIPLFIPEINNEIVETLLHKRPLKDMWMVNPHTHSNVRVWYKSYTATSASEKHFLQEIKGAQFTKFDSNVLNVPCRVEKLSHYSLIYLRRHGGCPCWKTYRIKILKELEVFLPPIVDIICRYASI
jgi:hypothetical protein